MRAVRFHGRRDIRIDEVEEPACGNGQVKASLALLLYRIRNVTSETESLTTNLDINRFDLPLSEYVAAVSDMPETPRWLVISNPTQISMSILLAQRSSLSPHTH